MNDITAVKKPYYHWLERAQLGSLDCAYLDFSQLNPLFNQPSQLSEAIELELGQNLELTDTNQQSLLSDLIKNKRHSLQWNQHTYVKLADALKLKTQSGVLYSLDQIGHGHFNMNLPRELNPIVIEKQFSLHAAKEKLRLNNFMKFLGFKDSLQNELLFGFVLLEMIDNLIILSTKYPQFKIYLVHTKYENIVEVHDVSNLSFDSENESILSNSPVPQIQTYKKTLVSIVGWPLSDFHVHSPIQSEYFVKPLNEEKLPFLGQFELTQSLQTDLKSHEIRWGSNSYDTKTKVFAAVPSLKSASLQSNQFKFLDLESETTASGLIFKNHSSLKVIKEVLKSLEIKCNYLNNPISLKPLKYGINLQHNHDPGYESIYYSYWSEFEFQNKTYRVHNDQRASEQIFKLASQGIVSFSGQDRKDMATSKKGLKRENDLKILKHQGVACLIIIEICRFILKKPLTSGQFDLTQEQLFEILENNIFDIFKKSILIDKFGEATHFEKSLSSYLSEKVYEYLKEVMLTTFQILSQKQRFLLLNQNIIELEQNDQFNAEAILIALEPILLESQGTLFTKATSKDLNYIEQTLENQLNHFEPIYEGFPLASELKNQFIHNQRINEVHLPAYYRKLSDLAQEGWDVYINTHSIEKLEEQDFQAELQVNVNKMDWFELSPRVFFKGVEISIEDVNFSGKGKNTLSSILFYKGKPYLIDPKSLPHFAALENFWEKLKNEQHGKGALKEKEFVKVPKSHVLELLALAESGTKIVSDHPYWQEIYSFYKNLGQASSQLKIEGELATILKEHQHIGLQWIYNLYRLNLGGVLADDMGLGKTLQVLGFFNQHRLEKNKTWSLIIVPTSLCFNWESEAKKFTPDLNVKVFTPSNREELLKEFQKKSGQKHTIILATYGLLTEHENFFNQILWDIVVFDEAQNLKNLSSKRTSSARTLKAKFKLALTGTPLENNFMDFFSIADLVLPGAMGTYRSFYENFGPGKPIDPLEVDFLRKKMKPIVLRRTKSSVNLNLPQKFEESIRFEFTEKQLEIYKNLAISHNEQVNQLIEARGAQASQLAMLTALLRLRQVCSDPNGIPNVEFKEKPPKIAHIVECVKEHFEEGQSVLIFTQFITTLEKISSLLKASGLNHAVMHGAVSAKNRRELLDQFQNSKEPQALIMTLKTGGVGLNLTKASVVYHVEPWWNPAVENQATDRSHRLGQKNEVRVYRLLMKDSVEEKIELLKLKKKSYFDSLFSDTEMVDKINQGEQSISAEDFKFLLGI